LCTAFEKDLSLNLSNKWTYNITGRSVSFILLVSSSSSSSSSNSRNSSSSSGSDSGSGGGGSSSSGGGGVGGGSSSKLHPISACVSGNLNDFVKQRLCGINKTVKAQDGESTCTVKLRCVHATIVAVGRQKVSHSLSVYFSYTYLACNAYLPYFYLCVVRLYNIFQHYLINGIIF